MSGTSAHKPRLVLHIGIHRTGTTSIQRWLHTNRKALMNQGVRYALDTENHTSLAWRIHSGKLAPARFIARLVEDAASSGAQTMIVSGEDFCVIRDASPLGALAEHFDVKVLCFLRRQDEWLESWYNQNIKWPWDPSFAVCKPDEFLARRDEFYWLAFDRMLDTWAKTFGEDRIRVVPFERDQMPGGPEHTFARLCGFDPEPLDTPKARVNSSVPPRALAFLRQLDLYSKKPRQRQVINQAVAAMAEHLPGQKVTHIWPDRTRREIVAQYDAGNRRVARRFLDQPDGRLFRAPRPSEDEALPALELPPINPLFNQYVNPVVRGITNQIINTTARLQAAESPSHWRSRLQARMGDTLQAIRMLLPGKRGFNRDLARHLNLERYGVAHRAVIREALAGLATEPGSRQPALGDDPEKVMVAWVEPLLSRLSTELLNRHQAVVRKAGS